MAEIIYKTGFQKELLKVITSLVNKTKWILPNWLEELTIIYEVDNIREGSSAEISSSYRYRKASLWVFPLFFSYDYNKMERILYHEFIHVLFDPFHNFAMDEIERLIDDQKNRESIQDTLMEKCEISIQDLSYCVFNKFGG